MAFGKPFHNTCLQHFFLTSSTKYLPYNIYNTIRKTFILRQMASRVQAQTCRFLLPQSWHREKKTDCTISFAGRYTTRANALVGSLCIRGK